MTRLRTFPVALAALVLLGVLIRVGYTIWIAPWPPRALTDEYYYSYLPSLIAHGAGIIDPLKIFQGRHDQTALHAPLYPFFLTGLYELGGTGQEAQRLLGSLFGAGTIIVLAFLGRRVAGDRVGLIAAAVAAVYPMLITADGALMSESLYGFLVALALLAAVRCRDTPHWRWGAALGAVAGLAALTRGEGFLLLLLLLIPIARTPGGVRTAGVALLTMLVVVAPWTVRNAVVFDRFVLVSNDLGITIAGANCAVTYGGGGVGSWFPGAPCTRAYPGNEAAVSARYQADGLHYAQHHLGRLPVVLLAREARVWGLLQPGLTDDGRNGTAERLGMLAYYALALLAIAGVLILRRRGRPLGILLTPFALVTIVVAGTFGLIRFREAAELSLVILSAVTIDQLWTMVSARRAAGRPAARPTFPDAA